VLLQGFSPSWSFSPPNAPGSSFIPKTPMGFCLSESSSYRVRLYRISTERVVPFMDLASVSKLRVLTVGPIIGFALPSWPLSEDGLQGFPGKLSSGFPLRRSLIVCLSFKELTALDLPGSHPAPLLGFTSLQRFKYAKSTYRRVTIPATLPFQSFSLS